LKISETPPPSGPPRSHPPPDRTTAPDEANIGQRCGESAAIGHLARSLGDLQDIVKALRAKGVALKVTDQPIDTSTAAGKAFLYMLGVFAELETSLRRERQMEGIAKAKAKGVYRGRKPVINAEQVKRLKGEGHRWQRNRSTAGHWPSERL
jgi:hypothetical protein